VLGILEECYSAGHLKVVVSHENGRLGIRAVPLLTSVQGRP
jgi:hypothetical protein